MMIASVCMRLPVMASDCDERLRSMARAKWIIHTTGRHRESIASIGSACLAMRRHATLGLPGAYRNSTRCAESASCDQRLTYLTHGEGGAA